MQRRERTPSFPLRARRRLRSRPGQSVPRRPGRVPLGARLARAPAGRPRPRRYLKFPGSGERHFIDDCGLWFLYAIVCLESAGLWLPGETALIGAAVLAAKGHLSIAGVIGVAAVAAIIGDNIGYWMRREGVRRPIPRYHWLRRRGGRILPPPARIFARHGRQTGFPSGRLWRRACTR